jgi:fatty acid desaturase
MDETRTAEQEQRAVRVGALILHAVALLTAAVLVAFSAWTAAFAVAVVAVVAGAWTLKLYNDLQTQAVQAQAQASAHRRIVAPPPADRFEG